jgi:WD40 repeat protein
VIRVHATIVGFRVFGQSISQAHGFVLTADHRLVDAGATSVSLVSQLPRPPMAFAFTQQGVITASPLLAWLPHQDPRPPSAQKHPYCAVSAIAASRRLMVTGGADGCVALWAMDGGEIVPIATVVAHQAAILCIAASSEYGIVATAAADASVVVMAARKTRLVVLWKAEMDMEPGMAARKIVICEASGIVAVLADRRIVQTFTLNGARAGRREFAFDVVDLCVVYGRWEGDFLCVSNPDGGISLVDCVLMKDVKQVGKAAGICTVQFVRPFQAIAAAADQEILLMPIEL